MTALPESLTLHRAAQRSHSQVLFAQDVRSSR